MKILILTHGFPSLSDKSGRSSGGEFLLAEAQAYWKAGAEVTVLTPHIPGLPLVEEIEENFTVIRFRYFFPLKFQIVRSSQPLYSSRNLILRILQMPFFVAAFLFSIVCHMRKNDIVHANWTPTALLAIPFQRLLKTPVVLTYRGSDLRLLPGWLNRFITRNVTAVLDIWGDTAWAKTQRKLFPGNYLKLPIISRSPETGDPIESHKNSNIHFAFVGRLASAGEEIMKGTTAVIPAAKIVAQKSSNIVIDIVGDGPDWEMMQESRKELKMEEHVIMHGFQLNVFPYICKSAAVIADAGLSAVVQEGALSKRLLIIPDVPEQNGDTWTHKENALLYAPGNAESLAEAMLYVVNNPEKADRIAAAGYKTIRRYVSRPDEGGQLYTRAFQKIIDHPFF